MTHLLTSNRKKFSSRPQTTSPSISEIKLRQRHLIQRDIHAYDALTNLTTFH